MHNNIPEKVGDESQPPNNCFLLQRSRAETFLAVFFTQKPLHVSPAEPDLLSDHLARSRIEYRCQNCTAMGCIRARVGQLNRLPRGTWMKVPHAHRAMTVPLPEAELNSHGRGIDAGHCRTLQTGDGEKVENDEKRIAGLHAKVLLSGIWRSAKRIRARRYNHYSWEMSARRKKKQTRRRKRTTTKKTIEKRSRRRRRRRQTQALFVSETERRRKKHTRGTTAKRTTRREKQRRKKLTVRRRRRTRRRRRRRTTRRRRRRTTTTTTTIKTASRTLFKTHRPDAPFNKKSPNLTSHLKKKLGVRCPSILPFQASKHPSGTQPFFEPPCTQFWIPTSQNGPNRTPPPPHPLE